MDNGIPFDLDAEPEPRPAPGPLVVTGGTYSVRDEFPCELSATVIYERRSFDELHDAIVKPKP